MAELFPIQDNEEYTEWLNQLPDDVLATVKAYPMNKLYRLKDSDRCVISSYAENGTVTVDITEQFNLTIINRQVFDVDPKELTECDLPHPDEDLGCIADTKEKSDAWIKCLQMIHLHEAGKEIDEAMPTDDEITLYGELRDELQRRQKANQALLRGMTNE